MNFTQDKIKHYNVSFAFGKYGSVFGALLIVCVGILKEVVWDWILGLGECEFNDIKANFIGAYEGMTFKKNRFSN